MSRPPRARDIVLDAFEELLAVDGERAATVDATARRAGVSKGGLLYHFASKDALCAALVERLRVLVDEDIEAITTASEGVVEYYIRTSVPTDHAMDRTVLAVARLAQAGDAAAAASLHEMRERWAQAVRPHVRDEAALALVLLVSDGMYFNSLLNPLTAAPVPSGASLDALIARVAEAVSV